MYLETVDSVDLEPELQQFTMDARGAPQGVLLAHPPDEIT
jgi:hypothetical protein